MTHTTLEPRNAAAANLNDAVTGLGRRTLDAIFRHPLSHNLAWREVITLFAGIGGAEEKHNGDLMFSLGAERLSMKKAHDKNLGGSDVMDLRRFLIRAGWSPDAAPALAAATLPEPHRLIVVIDRGGATIHRVETLADGAHGLADEAPIHLPHHVERTSRGDVRDEADPNDERLFGSVAAAVADGGEIVIIGHGKGQSSEADHLAAYLEGHHKQTYHRLVRQIVADLAHLTPAQLLDLGRHAFG